PNPSTMRKLYSSHKDGNKGAMKELTLIKSIPKRSECFNPVRRTMLAIGMPPNIPITENTPPRLPIDVSFNDRLSIKNGAAMDTLTTCNAETIPHNTHTNTANQLFSSCHFVLF